MWLVSTWLVGGNLPFPLSAGEYSIGRSKKCKILIRDSSISRIHARLTVTPAGDLHLIDLGSENGVFVNGQKLTETRPDQQDRIRLGLVPLLFTDTPGIHGAENEVESTLDPSGLRPKNHHRFDAELSCAQTEVLQLVALGLSDEEIATLLARSHNTVRNHLKVIFKVYGVNSKLRLVAMLNGRS